MPHAAAAPERAGAPGYRGVLVLLPLALAAWVYLPITRVYFFADDFVHLASIASDRVAAFLLQPFGGHNYLGRNVVFLASYRLLGLRADLYYWCVLLTHLLNVALLFGVLRAVTASALLACFGAALWGMLPLHVGTLGWYSVYGHALAVTTTLLVLHALAHLASAGGPLRLRTASAWIALLLVGTTFFGVGLGVALAFPLVVFLMVPDAWRQRDPRTALLLLPIVTLVLYFVLRWVANQIEPLSPEEVMQQRVAQTGFDAVPPMFAQLLAFAMAGTVLGPLLPETDPSAASVVASVAFGGGLAFAIWRGDWPARRAMLAMLVLAGGIYFVIALGRAHAYQVFHIPFARAASVSRYHYAGSIPLTVLLCLVLQQIGRVKGVRAVPSGLALAAGLVVLAIGHQRAGLAIDEHFPCREYVARTLREVAAAVASQPDGATVYPGHPATPPYLLGPALGDRLFPGRAAVFLITHRSDTLDGRRVRFIERDPKVLKWYLDRPETRLAQLLVSPETATTQP